jgi:MFS family permease
MTSADRTGEMPAPEPAAAPPKPRVRRVIVANLISVVGSQMTILAIPWFVLITTGSETRMGFVFGAELLPIALFGIPAGLLVRRLGVRRTVVTGDAISAVLICLIPLLHHFNALPFAALLIIVAAIGAVTAPYLAAQRLLLPEILGDDESAVTGGNALLEGSSWGARLIGPALAGFLIATVGALNVLWIDAGTYVVSAALLFGVPRKLVDLSAGATSPGALAGARYVLADSVLRRIIIAAVGYGLLVPFLVISLPILADIRFGANPHVAGWLLAAWGGGAVLGAFGVAPALQKVPPLTLGALGAVALAIPLWLLPIRQPVATIAAIMIVSGVFVPVLNAPLLGVLSVRPPAELRAQVLSFAVTMSLLASPLAYVVAGTLFSHFGLSKVFIGVAAAATLCALLLLTLVRGAGSAAELADVDEPMTSPSSS